MHKENQQFFKALAETLVKSEGRMDWYSFLLEVALNNFTFFVDFEQTFDAKLYYLFDLNYLLE